MARTARNIPAHVRETLGRVTEMVDRTIAGMQGTWAPILVLPQGNRRPYPTRKVLKSGRVKLHSRTSKAAMKSQPTNTEVLGWFTEKRDILKLTAENRRDFGRAVRERLTADARETNRVPTVLEVMQASALEYKEHLVRRFQAQGLDLRLKPLSASWKARKQLLHLDPRIGVASGQLAAAIARAQIIPKKIR